METRDSKPAFFWLTGDTPGVECKGECGELTRQGFSFTLNHRSVYDICDGCGDKMRAAYKEGLIP